VGDGCEYEYYDTSKVHVQVWMQILLPTHVLVIVQLFFKTERSINYPQAP
jgi:hypothetical protein